MSLVMLLLSPTWGSAQPATDLLARAMQRAGGESALRNIRTARFEYVTTWYRTSFSGAPAAVSSIESNVDVRDYGRRIWRYERRFSQGAGTQVVTDIVRDTVAIFHAGNGWQPLSGAYLDERQELFMASPDQLLLMASAAARAGALQVAGDTTIGGSRHARVTGTLEGIPVTLFLRHSDAGLTQLRYHAAQPWDFGLAAWGTMATDVRYARWSVANGVLMPYDVAIDRVGVPYKRLLMTRIQFNQPIEEDSVSVSDSLRRRYVAEQRRAMFDRPVDSLRVTDGVATFGVPGTPAAALQRRDGWVLLGTGSAPLITRRALDAFRGAPVRAALVGTYAVSGVGGAPTIAAAGIPLFASAGARAWVTTMFAQQRVPLRGVTWVSRGAWHVLAGDSLWIEPVELPDADGGLLAWDPAARRVFPGDALGIAQLRTVLDVIQQRGWPVARVFFRGSMMSLADVRTLAGLP